MARTVATLPAGSRITDYISLGVIAKAFPVTAIRAALAETRKAGMRQRDLPAHVVVLRHRSGALHAVPLSRGLALPAGRHPVAAGSLGQSQGGRQVGHFAGRARLGWEPLRQLHDELVKPIAVETTQGAWYRQWRLVSLDGSTLDVADEKANEESFGRPGASRGNSAYPQIRFVALLENGTHVLFGSQLDVYEAGEITLANGCCRACARACCAWPIGTSSASSYGSRCKRRARNCCGE